MVPCGPTRIWRIPLTASAPPDGHRNRRTGDPGTNRAVENSWRWFGLQEYLTINEVAELVRASPATVRYWRHAGKGPRGFKLGRRVLYSRRDVDDWLASVRQR
ncbi:MAG: helix-turn-helix domain-containing protein [Sciscionella sp.]